jgi:cytoskeletal protein RodZ
MAARGAGRGGRWQMADTVSLSGWVLADVLLGLLLVFLVSVRGAAPPTPTPTPTARSTGIAAAVSPTATPTATPTVTPTATATATATPTPTPTPTPTATATATATPKPCAPTARLEDEEVTAAAGPGGSDPTQAELRAKFQPFVGKQVGLLYAYGHARTTGEGIELARRTIAVLQSLFPDMFPPEAILKPLRNDPIAVGAVSFEVYLLDTACR